MNHTIKSMIEIRKLKKELSITKKIINNKPLLYTILSIISFNISFNIFIYLLVKASFHWMPFITCSLLSIGYLSIPLYLAFYIIIEDSNEK